MKSHTAVFDQNITELIIKDKVHLSPKRQKDWAT